MATKKTPKKADPMLGALAASFGTAKLVPVEKETVVPKPLETAQNGGGESAEIPTPISEEQATVPNPGTPTQPPIPAAVVSNASLRGVKKTTVSFHDTEQDKVDEILDALKRSRRHRGGFSDAIKIALRLCPLDDEAIGAAWDEARSQDQRVLRHRRDS